MLRNTRGHGVRAKMLGAIICAGVLGCLSACGGGDGDDVVEGRPAKLIEITASSNERLISLPAVIEAASSADVTFQVAGALVELPVDEGQEVERGDVLARLDQRDFRNSLQQAQAQFNSAQSEFARAETLIAENAISRSIFEQRRSQRDVARAQLDTARKALDDSVLVAPFDGVVATRHVENFQNVAPQQPIVTIQTTGAAEARVNIPATLVAYSGQITPIETSVILDAAPETPMSAVMLSTSTQADPATQTFASHFSFTPPETLLILPGMAGTLRARLLIAGNDETASQITVPLPAVLAEGDDTFVWVVDPETMSVSKRAVEISQGRGIGDNLILESGLEAGDIIVGAGASYLFEGMKVRPYEQ